MPTPAADRRRPRPPGHAFNPAVQPLPRYAIDPLAQVPYAEEDQGYAACDIDKYHGWGREPSTAASGPGARRWRLRPRPTSAHTAPAGLQIGLRRRRLRKVVGVQVALALPEPFVGRAALVAQVRGHRLHGLLRQRALRRPERERGRIALGSGRDVKGRVRERQLRLGQADEIHRVLRGDRERQGLRVGQPHVLARQNDQPPGNEARILPAPEHLCQPVERGVGIPSPAALDEGGNRVVVLVLVGVVADAALAREHLQLRGRDRRALGQAERDDLEGVQRAPQVAVAEDRQVGKDRRVGRDATRAQAAVGVGQGPGEHPRDRRRRQGLQAEQVAAGQQRGVDVETRVVRGRADQPHAALLDVRQQQVLLRLVEPVQLVDEKDRRRLRPAPGRRENLAQLGDIRHHGVQADEPAAGLVGDRLGDARLARAGRAVENQRAEAILGHEPGQEAARAQKMLLADHLVQPARPHPGGQGAGASRAPEVPPGAGKTPSGRARPWAGRPSSGFAGKSASRETSSSKKSVWSGSFMPALL